MPWNVSFAAFFFMFPTPYCQSLPKNRGTECGETFRMKKLERQSYREAEICFTQFGKRYASKWNVGGDCISDDRFERRGCGKLTQVRQVLKKQKPQK